ncbi:tumor necrosis factor receptor superfamily member 1A-like [Heterodontus francisci]|uniref:tumor necrosis factor receptor superfamily member 1A-like n=1 Tax=Heterodontus francisci TaxID=7792 RepID=UPI00355BAB9E
MGCIGQRRLKRASVPQYHNETGSTSPSELVVGKTQSLLPIQEMAFQADSGYFSAPCSELPDCVQIAGKTQLPNSSQVNYVIADLVPASRWKEFVRRLGMNDHDIERSEMDNRQSFREAQYTMVKIWRDRQGGKGATTEAICKVLKDMDLNGCAEQFQEALQ